MKEDFEIPKIVYHCPVCKESCSAVYSYVEKEYMCFLCLKQKDPEYLLLIQAAETQMRKAKRLERAHKLKLSTSQY